MSVVVGSRIDPYEIVAAIGAGGPPPLEARMSNASSSGEVSPTPSVRTR